MVTQINTLKHNLQVGKAIRGEKKRKKKRKIIRWICKIKRKEKKLNGRLCHLSIVILMIVTVGFCGSKIPCVLPEAHTHTACTIRYDRAVL